MRRRLDARAPFRCINCGEPMVEYREGNGTGYRLVGLTCYSCGLAITLELGPPAPGGSLAPSPHALRCLNCGALLSAEITGSDYQMRLACRVCKGRYRLTMPPATGAPPSASDASSSRPATPASTGRSP